MLFLRHASAGERSRSPNVDRFRRLDEAGRIAAHQLVRAFAQHEISRIVSSPLPRCVETVIPLAENRGLVVENRWELQPDGSLEDLLVLLEDLPDTSLVCTHREVFETLFDGEVTCEKAGAWRVVRGTGGWLASEYLAAPVSGSRDHARVAAGSF